MPPSPTPGRKPFLLETGSVDEKGLPVLECDGTAPESQFWSTAQLADAGMNDRDIRKSVLAGQSFKSSSSKGPVDVRRHFRGLPSNELTTVRSLPVTTLERTVVDCAASLSYRQALIIADHAARLGADQEQMSPMASAMNGVCGVKGIRRVLADLNPLSESPGETLTRILIMETGLDMPQLQLQVSTRSGRHRLDFGWVDAKVALEFDGDTKYFDYAPTPTVLLAERKREKALMEQGWVFVRLEWKDLFQPEEVERRINDAFRKASAMRRMDRPADGVSPHGGQRNFEPFSPRREPGRRSARAS